MFKIIKTEVDMAIGRDQWQRKATNIQDPNQDGSETNKKVDILETILEMDNKHPNPDQEEYPNTRVNFSSQLKTTKRNLKKLRSQ